MGIFRVFKTSGRRRIVTAPCTFRGRAGQCPAEARRRMSVSCWVPQASFSIQGGPARFACVHSRSHAPRCSLPCACPPGSLAVSCGCPPALPCPSRLEPPLLALCLRTRSPSEALPQGRVAGTEREGSWEGQAEACRDARAGACAGWGCSDTPRPLRRHSYEEVSWRAGSLWSPWGHLLIFL